MTKKVCVSIRGLHSQPGEEENDNIEVMNIGTYAKRNGKHWVRYEEMGDRGGELTASLIKFNEREMEILSKGQTGTHLIFTQGQKNLSHYETPFGGMNMGVETYDLNVEETENHIGIDVRYGLEINLDYVTNCRVHIDIDSVEES